MQAQNFDSTLIAFKKRVPVQPFTITLVNGESYEVDHPEALVVRDGVALYAGPGGVPVIFDHEGVAQITGDLKNPAEA